MEQRINAKSKRICQARKLDMEGLKEDVHKHPDLYQYERVEKFNANEKSVCYFKIKLKNINQRIGLYPISMKVFLHLICRENMATQKWEKDVMRITTGMQKEEKM